MADVTIRQAGDDDAPFMLDMFRMLAEHIGEQHLMTATLDDVRRDAFGPDRHYDTLIACADSAPVGLAVYFATYSTYAGAPCLFVNDLVVDPAARGLKVGRRLMAELAAIAIERNCCRLDLHVHHANEARGFYESIGMTMSEELPYIARGTALEQLASRQDQVRER